MNLSGTRAAVSEVRNALAVARGGESAAGGIVVGGMLAEQLAREVGAGAEAGAVRVVQGPAPDGAAVLVRVIAGEPSDDDEEVVAIADRAGIPTVLVQLWPQPDWTPPFVLSPFVVECSAGKGFPVRRIADRIVEAVEQAPALAARAPVLREPVAGRSAREATVRAGLLGLVGSSRPAIALEQLRLVPRLRPLSGQTASAETTPQLAGTVAGVLASGFAFRSAARMLGRALPAPVANALVAAAGTWAVAQGLQRADEVVARLPRS